MELSPADLKSIKIVEAATRGSYGDYWGSNHAASVYPMSSTLCYPSTQQYPTVQYSVKYHTSVISSSLPTYPYSSYPTTVAAPVKSGIHIKTYKDREKQKEDRKTSLSIPSPSPDTVDMYGSGIGDSYTGNINNTIESTSETKEFSKQGGIALFEDIMKSNK